MDFERKLYGVYRAVVHDNRDPDNQRRLKLKVTATGQEITNWVWPLDTYSLNTVVPKIGQGVLVNYIGGDPEYPIWLGSFGEQPSDRKRIYVEHLLNSINVSTITSYLIIKTHADNSKEVDLTATLVAMGLALRNHETRITTLEGKVATLEGKVATLESQMSGKANVGHSH